MKKYFLLMMLSTSFLAFSSTGDRVEVFNKDFPYICKVLIMKEEAPKISSTCSGTLISSNKILTARHCKPKNPKAPVLVDCNGKISAMLAWSNFEAGDNPSSDLAIITLAFPVESDVMYLARNRKHANDMLKKGECYIMGFGKQSIMEEASVKEEFNAVRLQPTTFEMLNLSIDFLRIFGEITSEQFVISGSHSLALSGDSGGPVICRGDNAFYQVAVHSFGSLEKGLDINVWAPDFSASTLISPALPWIKNKLLD